MIALAIRNPLIIATLAIAILASGYWAYQRLAVDAIPDLSDPQVVVTAQWPGRSPEDVYVQVTSRIASDLQGVAGARTVRGTTLPGAAFVQVLFSAGVGIADARAAIIERLSSLQGHLPKDVVARIAPDTTAMSQVFAFTVQGPRDIEARRRIIDQTIVPSLRSIPGVAEAAPVGGVVREYHVDVDPLRLEEQGLSMEMVAMALQRSGRDVGAMSVENAGLEAMVRGVGALRSVGDVESIIVRGERKSGAGLFLKDIATISVGGASRQGILSDEHGEQAGVIVSMRRGADPTSVIQLVRARLDELSSALARDELEVVPYYDRSLLIQETRATLHHTMMHELIVTILVVMAFLMHVRSCIAISITLPLGLFATFLAMHSCGIPANLMSLAGIAIAIGVMVDMGIVVAENIFQRLTALQQRLAEAGESMPGSPWDARIVETVRSGVSEVSPAIITASLTTIVGFVPIFALDGQAGRLFAPLAATKTLAIASAAIFGLFLVPMLCRLLLPPWQAPRWIRIAAAVIIGAIVVFCFANGFAVPMDHGRWRIEVSGWVAAPVMGMLSAWVVWTFGGERLRPASQAPVSHGIQVAYRWILTRILDHKRLFLGTCVLIAVAGFLAGSGYSRLSAPLRAVAGSCGVDLRTTGADRWLRAAFPGLGDGFLPPLDEGGLLFMPSILSQGGIGESLRIMQSQNRAIAAVPEVASLMGKLGRAESGLDPAPTGMVETVIQLKPYRDWPEVDVPTPGGTTERRPRTLTEVRAALAEATDIPGVAPSWLQPIEARVVMLADGIKSPVALQVAGDDRHDVQRFTEAVERILRLVPGAVDVSAQREDGKPYAEVRLDDQRLARYGLDREGAMMSVEAALGGMPVAATIEANQRYAVRLRYARERRDDPDELALTQVGLMVGGHGAITLSSLVKPPQIHLLTCDPALDPLDIRRGLTPEHARNLTIVAPGKVEMTVPAGESLPPAIALALASGRMRLDSIRPHPHALTWTIGPMSVRSENGKRVSHVFMNPAEGVAQEVVAESNRRIASAIRDGSLEQPANTTYRWVGRSENQARADRIMRVVIGASLCLMVILIYLGTRRWMTTAVIVCANLPVTVGGALLALWAWDVQLTIAVAVGFLALLGTMFNDGILIGIYLDQLFKDVPADVQAVRQRVIAGGLRRIRPALMTNVVAIAALAPVLWLDGRGSEIMTPMALPIIGGMCVNLVSVFTVPCVYAWYWERRVRRAQS
ncbi:MAG: efflux RND transporter permease subunit [Planctomycetes bacterium]|nr:efflux RND transporter permease subunit [Planctomycetota bacterium]